MDNLWFMLEGVENGGWVVRVGLLRTRYFPTIQDALKFILMIAGKGRIRWEDLKK